jgi:hypothetical protein
MQVDSLPITHLLRWHGEHDPTLRPHVDLPRLLKGIGMLHHEVVRTGPSRDDQRRLAAVAAVEEHVHAWRLAGDAQRNAAARRPVRLAEVGVSGDPGQGKCVGERGEARRIPAHGDPARANRQGHPEESQHPQSRLGEYPTAEAAAPA